MREVERPRESGAECLRSTTSVPSDGILTMPCADAMAGCLSARVPRTVVLLSTTLLLWRKIRKSGEHPLYYKEQLCTTFTKWRTIVAGKNFGILGNIRCATANNFCTRGTTFALWSTSFVLQGRFFCSMGNILCATWNIFLCYGEQSL